MWKLILIEIRREKKQQILDAALIVFSEKGYHAASIANIANISGVSKGLMYNYFKNKEDLLKQVMINGFHKIFDTYLIKDNLSPEENLLLLVNNSFDFMERMHDVLMVYFSILLNKEVFPIIKDKLNEMSEPLMKGFAKIMEELGFEKPMEEAFFLRFILDGISMNYILITDEFPKEYCIKRIREIYIK